MHGAKKHKSEKLVGTFLRTLLWNRKEILVFALICGLEKLLLNRIVYVCVYVCMCVRAL